MKQKGTTWILWIALILALIGSLRHVAWAFASLEAGDMIWGYVQAVAVDLGIATLAYAIQERKSAGRPVADLWLGVAVFSVISAYANLLHGEVFAAELPIATMWGMAAARPVLLSAVLPLLVLYLSEIVGEDNRALAAEAERKRRREEQKAERERRKAEQAWDGPGGIIPTPEQAARARASRRERHEEAMERFLAYVAEHPMASYVQIGAAIGRKKSTVSDYVRRLEEAGRIKRNGQGIEVLG